MNKKLDIFGSFFIKNFRDISIELAEGLCNNKYKSPGHKAYQKKLDSLTDEQKKILIETVGYCMDSSLNNFLQKLYIEDKSTDAPLMFEKEKLSELIDKKDIAKTFISWIKKYSSYPSYFI